MRSIVDWDYYKGRLEGTILKIVTIPAALHCMNPVQKIKYPDWLHKRLKAQDATHQQKNLMHFFQQMPKPLPDIEDLSGGPQNI